MDKLFAGVRFTKVRNATNSEWHDWLSDETPIRYLNNERLRIVLEFDERELDLFDEQIDATVTNVLLLNAEDRKRTNPHLFAYYKDIEFEIGKGAIENMPVLKSDDDIFNYVRLTRLGVSEGSIAGGIYANFTGGCEWEIEHGVSISFLNGKDLAMVSSVGHVCNSDAYADNDKDEFIYIGSNFKTTRE